MDKNLFSSFCATKLTQNMQYTKGNNKKVPICKHIVYKWELSAILTVTIASPHWISLSPSNP